MSLFIKNKITLLVLLFTTTFALAFSCPYKDFDQCVLEIGKELPPELKPFVQKQCTALGCRAPFNPSSQSSQDLQNQSSVNQEKRPLNSKKVRCQSQV